MRQRIHLFGGEGDGAGRKPSAGAGSTASLHRSMRRLHLVDEPLAAAPGGPDRSGGPRAGARSSGTRGETDAPPARSAESRALRDRALRVVPPRMNAIEDLSRSRWPTDRAERRRAVSRPASPRRDHAVVRRQLVPGSTGPLRAVIGHPGGPVASGGSPESSACSRWQGQRGSMLAIALESECAKHSTWNSRRLTRYYC